MGSAAKLSRPFRATAARAFRVPGLRPGLSSRAPSGLRESRPKRALIAEKPHFFANIVWRNPANGCFAFLSSHIRRVKLPLLVELEPDPGGEQLDDREG